MTAIVKTPLAVSSSMVVSGLVIWIMALVQGDAAERRGCGGLARVDDGQAERGFQREAVAGHAGAAEDQHIGAVTVAELRADLGHSVKRGGLVGKRRHAEAKGPVAGEAVHDAHGAEGAQVDGGWRRAGSR